TRSQAHEGKLGGYCPVRCRRVSRVFRRGIRRKWCTSRGEVFGKADILLKIQAPTIDEIGRMKEDSFLVSFLQPYTNTTAIKALAARRITAFSMEFMPRITRAQSMDALSAMSTVAGYKAVLIAA